MRKFQSCPTDQDIIERMQQSLVDPDMKNRIRADFATTFAQIGMPQGRAEELADNILKIIPHSGSRADFEHKKHAFLTEARVAGGGKFLDAMAASMQGRAELIQSQLHPHIQDFTRPVLEFGAGDGQVAREIANKNKRLVEAFDVAPFPHPSVRIPIRKYDGKRIPRGDKSFPDAIATNVLHHEANNQVCIDELRRLVRQRIILIETVPVGADKEAIECDRWRTFMNDIMWNIILKKPLIGIPVPGTYETPEGWIARFEKNGWKCTHSEDLGVDQKTIQDTHHLLVFDSRFARGLKFASKILEKVVGSD